MIFNLLKIDLEDICNNLLIQNEIIVSSEGLCVAVERMSFQEERRMDQFQISDVCVYVCVCVFFLFLIF